MVELSPDAQKLLALLRNVDDPTPSERSRAHAAVRRMLQAQGLRSLPRLPPPLIPQQLPAQTVAARSGGALKLLWGAGMGIVVTLGLLLAALGTPMPQARPSPVVMPAAARSAPATQPLVAPPSAAMPEAAPTPQPPSPEPPREAARHLEGARPAASSLAAELRFLTVVDAEIRDGAYESALRRLDRHKGSAQFQEERAALRVLALCGRDNDPAAARARARFLKGSPSSVLAARVQAACSTGAAP